MTPLRFFVAIDVIEVLVSAMHFGRSPYRWYFNIMDIPICVICFVIRSKRPESIRFTKTSVTSVAWRYQSFLYN